MLGTHGARPGRPRRRARSRRRSRPPRAPEMAPGLSSATLHALLPYCSQCTFPAQLRFRARHVRALQIRPMAVHPPLPLSPSLGSLHTIRAFQSKQFNVTMRTLLCHPHHLGPQVLRLHSGIQSDRHKIKMWGLAWNVVMFYSHLQIFQDLDVEKKEECVSLPKNNYAKKSALLLVIYEPHESPAPHNVTPSHAQPRIHRLLLPAPQSP